MCKGQGGTSNQVSSVSIPPDVAAKYNQVWGMGEQAASQPFQSYSGEFVAPVTGTTQGGINAISGAGNWIGPTYGNATSAINAGVAGSAPYYGAAGGNYGAAAGLAGASTGAVNPTAVDPAAINQFMSPYIQSVVDPTTKWLNQQNALQQTNLNSNAISSGAFGGDRAGLASAVLSGQQNMAEAPEIAGLYNQGYSQALAAAQQQQGVYLGAGQANRAALQTGAGLLSGIAGGETGLGTNVAGTYFGAGQGYGAAGNQAFQNSMAQAQGQIGAGLIPQQTQQAQDTALYNQFLQQQAYPFQTSQFLGNLAMGIGPNYGSTTTQNAFQPQPFFSDDRLKEDVHEIGRTKDGLKIVRYRYKEDPHKLLRIGFLASDVEKKMPEAVSEHGGLRAVDYERAAHAQGGVVNDNWDSMGGFVDPGTHMRAAFAEGGGSMPGFDPATMAAIVAAQQAMYPGAAGRAGIGGTGPRGMQLSQAQRAQLKEAPLMKLKEQKPELQEDLQAASSLNKAGSDIGSLYGTGKDALVGSAAKGTVGSSGYTPATGGLVGTGGAWDWNSGWLGRNTGAGGVLAPNVNPAGDLNNVPADAAAWPTARGGRLKRAAGGGMSGFIPYDTGDGYVPAADYAPFARSPGGLQTGRSGGTGAGAGGSGSGVLGSIGNLASLGKLGAQGISGLSSLFGSGGVGADALPMSGLGALTGDAAVGATAGGADAIMGLAPLLALRTGGRAGYQDGGGPDDDTQVAEAPPTAGLVVPPRDNVVPFARNPERPAAREREDKTAALVPDLGEGPGRYVDTPPPTAGVVPPPATPAPAATSAPTPLPAPRDNWPAMIRQESGGQHFDPKTGQPTTSSAGARGIAQVMPSTGPIAAKLAGVPWDPELFNRPRTGDPVKDQEAEDYNRKLGRAYYDDQLKTFGDPNIASAAYNAGPDRVQQALAKARATGQPYLNFLPQETQDYVRIVSGQGGPGGSRAVALNAAAPVAGAAAGPAGGAPTAGVAPQPDWWDRNEKYVIPALSFLGNMLASPSRTLAGSIGSGIVGATRALPQQQELAQGQQRIDITQRAQYMSLWAQLRQMWGASVTAANPGGDPALKAQMDRLAALVAQTGGVTGGPAGGAAAPGGPDLTAGGGSPGLVPTATPPAGGGVLPAPAAAAPQVSTSPLPPPPAVPPVVQPTPAPAPAGQPENEAALPSVQRPKPEYTPAFLAALEPSANPVAIREQARTLAAAGRPEAQQLYDKANAIEKQIQDTGQGIGVNGPVTAPNAEALQQSQNRVKENAEWQRTQAPVAQQRQITRDNLQHVIKTLETFQPGAFAQVKADLSAMAAGVTGIKPPVTSTMNPAEYEKFLKAIAAVQASAVGVDHGTDMARSTLNASLAHPEQQPEAVRANLATALGQLDYSDELYKDQVDKMQRYPWLNQGLRLGEFTGRHPVEKYVADHEANMAVRGATPDKPADLKQGQAYIVEPEQAKLWHLPGIDKPTKLRFKGVEPDGRVRFGRIQ